MFTTAYFRKCVVLRDCFVKYRKCFIDPGVCMAQLKFFVTAVSEKKLDFLQLTGARKYQVLGNCKARKKPQNNKFNYQSILFYQE